MHRWRRSSSPGQLIRIIRLLRLPVRAAADRGSASLELLTLGVLVLVPLAYLALSLASIQSAALCAEGAARHAGRILADGGADENSLAVAETAIEFALADHGLDPASAEVGISCLPADRACGSTSLIAVDVTVAAPLPLVPDLLDPAGRASIPVSAQSAFPLARFQEGAP